MQITEWNRVSLPKEVVSAFEKIVSTSKDRGVVSLTKNGQAIPQGTVNDYGKMVERIRELEQNPDVVKVFYCDTYGIHQW